MLEWKETNKNHRTMRVLNGSSWAWVVDGSLNRNRGGRAGLPRQAELIPLIPATLQAAGTSAGPGQHSQQVCQPGEDGQGQRPSPTPWEACMDARLSLQLVKSVRSNSRFSSLLCFILNISSLVTGLRLLHSGLLLLNLSLFCLREMYAVWWPPALNYNR